MESKNLETIKGTISETLDSVLSLKADIGFAIRERDYQTFFGDIEGKLEEALSLLGGKGKNE